MRIFWALGYQPCTTIMSVFFEWAMPVGSYISLVSAVNQNNPGLNPYSKHLRSHQEPAPDPGTSVLGGTLRAPLRPAQACPRKPKESPRKEKRKNKGNRDPPLSLFRGCHEGGRGEKRGYFSPSAPNSSASAFRSSSRSHSDTSLPASSSAGTSLPTSVAEEVQYRLTAPHIGEEVPDLGPHLPPPALLPHQCCLGIQQKPYTLQSALDYNSSSDSKLGDEMPIINQEFLQIRIQLQFGFVGSQWRYRIPNKRASLR